MECRDLTDWNFLENSNSSDFKKVYLFRDRALLLKNDGTLHGIGNNENYLIGEEDKAHWFNEWNLISGDSDFKDVTTNGKHALAITKGGYLYSWGSNEHGQLGRDGSNSSVIQVEKTFAIKIKEAFCGAGFSCVLTEDNRVFEWGIHGFNELILETHDEMDQPAEGKEYEKIVSIHGTKHYPIILTESGKVFLPSLKQIISKCNSNLHIEKISALGPMKGIRVKRVLSGRNHVFALTHDGEIFHWPANWCDCYGQHERRHLAKDIGRVIEIWAATSHDVLVAAVSLGILYSITLNGITPSISKIDFSSATAYFAKFKMEVQEAVYDKITMNINEKEDIEVFIDWRRRFDASFNNKDGSDISFFVDGKIIYAHRAILSIQSSYLNAVLNSDWKENSESNHVIIEGYSYNAYLKYMRFLYTGKLESSSHEHNLELIKLAHEYMDEPLLKICVKMVIRGLTAENAFSTYRIATILGLEEVRELSKSFIGNNLESTILGEDISYQDTDSLVRCLRDMVCSNHIAGVNELNKVNDDSE